MLFKKKKDKAADAATPPAAPAGEAAPPKKRSKLKLALLACAPLVLGGAGYGGWAFYAGGEAAYARETTHGEHAAEGEHDAAGQDGAEAALISDDDVAAENSFTYSLALSELLKEECGEADVTALKAAAGKEAAADGRLVNLSWMAAARRIGTITEKSCSRMLSEIGKANLRALEASAPKKEAAHH